MFRNMDHPDTTAAEDEDYTDADAAADEAEHAAEDQLQDEPGEPEQKTQPQHDFVAGDATHAGEDLHDDDTASQYNPDEPSEAPIEPQDRDEYDFVEDEPSAARPQPAAPPPPPPPRETPPPRQAAAPKPFPVPQPPPSSRKRQAAPERPPPPPPSRGGGGTRRHPDLPPPVSSFKRARSLPDQDGRSRGTSYSAAPRGPHIHPTRLNPSATEKIVCNRESLWLDSRPTQKLESNFSYARRRKCVDDTTPNGMQETMRRLANEIRHSSPQAVADAMQELYRENVRGDGDVSLLPDWPLQDIEQQIFTHYASPEALTEFWIRNNSRLGMVQMKAQAYADEGEGLQVSAGTVKLLNGIVMNHTRLMGVYKKSH